MTTGPILPPRAKPSAHNRPLADYHGGPTEKIIEVTNGLTGPGRKVGLISLRTTRDGDLVIDVFALDEGITVNVTPDRHPQYIVTPTYRNSGLDTFGPFDSVSEAETHLTRQHLAATHEIVLKQLSE